MSTYFQDKTPFSPVGRKAGDRAVKIINGVEFAFRWCPAGEFMMGNSEFPDAAPHKVTLTKGFWIMETEVTQKQWDAVITEHTFSPSYFKGNDLPIEQVSWNDCQRFCNQCQNKGFTLRLPTEAQWEYACRAGSTTDYSWGNKLNGDKANCKGTEPYGTKNQGTYLRKTTLVKSYPPNDWGVYDMHGNVNEWCLDYFGSYPNYVVSDPVGPTNGTHIVVRGGGWATRAKNCQSAYRDMYLKDHQDNDLGFRCVINPK